MASENLELAHPALIAMSVITGFVNKSRIYPFHKGSKRAVLVAVPLLAKLGELVKDELMHEMATSSQLSDELHDMALNYLAKVWQYSNEYAPTDVSDDEISAAIALGDGSSDEVINTLFDYIKMMHDEDRRSTLDCIMMTLAFFISKHVKAGQSADRVMALLFSEL